MSKNSEAVHHASRASGLPVVNKLFTFDGDTFTYTLPLTDQADTDSVFAFYEAHKDVPFYWFNPQDEVTYEVVFAEPPKRNIDKLKTRWKITVVFHQYAPV
ncbi:MAG: hypothetical protein JW837_18175 [Sedimentisphaerales bacterium]|nr:hypothetical protein [Sedimentisphaerales bacterium]